jgi:peptidase E
MKKIVLFSMPTDNNIGKLTKILFPTELPNKILAYMPSNGNQTRKEFTDYWRNIAKDNNTEFLFVDNMLHEDSNEAKKIDMANILLITGGNTFELLNNLRQSKLDQAVIKFTQKPDYILSGFSAGAIVLTPKIDIAGRPSGDDPNDFVDENKVGITDLTGLNIVDFEILPHFIESTDRETLESYRKETSNEVKEITNNDFIEINL